MAAAAIAASLASAKEDERKRKRTVAELVKRSLVIEGGVEQGYVRLHDLQSAISNLRYAVRSEPGDASDSCRTGPEWHCAGAGL